VEQLTHILSQVPGFARLRRDRVAVHPYYRNSSEPFAVWVTNITGENFDGVFYVLATVINPSPGIK
jgi:hypothetical protein